MELESDLALTFIDSPMLHRNAEQCAMSLANGRKALAKIRRPYWIPPAATSSEEARRLPGKSTGVPVSHWAWACESETGSMHELSTYRRKGGIAVGPARAHQEKTSEEQNW